MRTLAPLALCVPLLAASTAAQARREAAATVVDKLLVDQAPAADTAADDINVVVGIRDMPPGWFYAKNGDQKKLFAAPGYPTSDDPGLVIAGLAWQGGSGPFSSEATMDAVKARAAELGANTIFSPSKTERFVYAVHVGSGSPPAGPSADSLLADLGKGVARSGYKTVLDSGSFAGGVLERDIELSRGHCYSVIAALDGDSQWSSAGGMGMSIDVASSDPLMGNRNNPSPDEAFDNELGWDVHAPYHGHYMHMRSLALPAGCAAASGTAHISIDAISGGSVSDGTVKYKLLEKTVSEAEVVKMQQDSDNAWAKTEMENLLYEWRKLEESLAAAESSSRSSASSSSSSASSSSSRGGSSSNSYSIDLHSDCSSTVKLVVGSPSGSGTHTDIGSNHTRSFNGTLPFAIKIEDGSGHIMSSWTASAGDHDLTIPSSCSGFVED